MTERIDSLILGAGIAGLAAALQARRSGVDAAIFEARDRPAGLLGNFTIDGFRFDTAVHLSFATEPEVRAVFDRTPYLSHKPESLNWDDGVWLRHPVQNNLYPLPIEDKVALIASLAAAQERPIANYEDWLRVQLGDAMAERWSLPYTEKYWTVPACELGTDWIGSRVRPASVAEALRGALTPETPNVYYAREMRYPERGGYRSFVDGMIADADIRLERRVIAIDAAARIVRFANGDEVAYHKLVSTIPLPRLIELIADVPPAIRADAASLFATEVDLVSIGFAKPDVAPALWFYIYDADIVAARAYAPGLKSPDNVPVGCSALQFEIYSSVRRPQALDADALKENIVRGVEKMGLATRADMLFVDHRRTAYGNVVFDLGMEERRDRVLDWVRAQGIGSAGRFGEWAYLWSNQAMMSGLAAGRTAFC